MNKIRIYVTAMLLIVPLAASAADPAAETTADNKPLKLAFVTGGSRTTNTLGQRLGLDKDGKGRFNKQDCIEKTSVRFNFEFTVPENAYGGREIRMYVGSACKGRLTETSLCRSFPVSGSRKESHSISELFGDDLKCSGMNIDGTELWLAPVGDWDPWLIDTKSNPIYIAYDMDNPAPPTLTSTMAGDKKVTAYWSDVEGGASSAVYILYYPFPGQSTPVDQATDTPADSEEVSDTDGNPLDGGDNADAGILTARRMEDGPVFSNAPPSADSETAVCPSDIGDVIEGEVPNAKGEKKYDIKTGNNANNGTVKELTNKEPYIFGLVTSDSFKNYSRISNTMCSTPGETDDFFEIYKDAGGKGGKFCFVATAAFGSYDHPSVQLLRMFRDRFLAKLPGGEQVIAAYYRVGPRAATFVEGHPMLRAAVVGTLTAAAGLSVPLSLLGPLGSLLGMLLIAGALVYRRKTRLSTDR